MIKSQRRALCLFSLGTFYMHMQSVPAGLMKSDLKSRALSVNPPLSRGTLCLIKQKKSRWSHRQTRCHLLGKGHESQVAANLDTHKRGSVIFESLSLSSSVTFKYYFCSRLIFFNPWWSARIVQSLVISGEYFKF